MTPLLLLIVSSSWLFQTLPFPGPKGPVIAAGTPAVTSYTPGTPRNDLDACLGGYFINGGAQITITQLARWKVAGNSLTHVVRVIDNATGNQLGNVTVDESTGSNAAFNYVVLASPIVIAAGGEFAVWSTEANGGDQWGDNDGTTVLSADIASIGSTFTIGACTTNPFPISGSVNGKQYVGINFKYTKP